MVDIGQSEIITAAEDIDQHLVPEVYYNLQNRFASIVFTVPHLDVGMPENPTLQPDAKGIVVVEKNYGRWKKKQFVDDIQVTDWKLRPRLDEVRWKGKTYTGEQLLEQKDQLLQEFFIDMAGGEDNVRQLRVTSEAAGLTEGSYLYRAIGGSEYTQLQREGVKYVNHLDPSANFESEAMYNGENSQVKHYASKTGEGESYSGHIIRWKIQDPVLYRPAGLNPPRVVPMFAHFLPVDMEISIDGGKTFLSLQSHTSSK